METKVNPCHACGKPLRKDAVECFYCKAKVPLVSTAPVSFPPIPGYAMRRFVAGGGMGAVYEAEETALGRRVALKVVSEKFLEEEGARARFQREARTMATVEHPNIVRVYAYGECEGKPYFAMEYIEGEVLAKRIEREGRLSVEEALRIVRQTAEALEAAWEKGIVHRDIKPSNVLLDGKGRVRVADFGLAKPLRVGSDATLTGQGFILGTPHYVSPEQAREREVDFRSDIYSLGIMFYEMLTGSRPFEGTTPFAIVEKHMNAPLPNIRDKRTDVPLEVQSLLEWMTAKDSAKRPASYLELLGAVESYLGFTPSTPIPTAQMPSLPPAGETAAWKKWVAMAVGVVVLAAIGLTAWKTFISRPSPGEGGASKGQEETRLVVAVTPFYGPDDDSIKEGRVMAALVENSIAERLTKEDVKLIGIEETKEPARDHDAARSLGEKLGANAVVWGEAFALRRETEIQPHFTLVPKKKAPVKIEKERSGADAAKASLEAKAPMTALGKQEVRAVKVEAETPNQIELRKTTASGVGDMVLFLAGMHALYNQNNAEKALKYFEKTPRTPESLRYRALALMKLNRKEDARKVLEDALAWAQFADMRYEAGEEKEAFTAYQKATEAGAFDMEHGVVFRGWLTFTAFVFSVLSVFICWESVFPVSAPGMVTGSLIPNLGDAFPLPHKPGAPILMERNWDMFWAWPGAKVFWSIVALSALLSLFFHFSRLKKIWSLRSVAPTGEGETPRSRGD